MAAMIPLSKRNYRYIRIVIAGSLLSIFGLLFAISAGAQPPGTFIASGPLPSARRSSASTLLPANRLLVMGGVDSSRRLTSLVAYNTASRTFNTVGNADAPYDTLTLLDDGKVLLAGRGNVISIGSNRSIQTTAQVYDPSTGGFTSTGPLLEGLSSAQAVRLADGRVLLLGGRISNGAASTATAEIYDPASGTFSFTGSMTTPRYNYTATLLQDGKVLVVGGISSSVTETPLASAELYDTATASFAPIGNMTTPHANHTATLLADGRVLIAGGSSRPSAAQNSVTPVAEIYDPVTNTFSVTSAMLTPREFHTATRLDNGDVLIAGGDNTLNVLASTELYDPVSGTFSAAAVMSVPRENFVAALLSDGDVLMAGGLTDFTEGANTATTEVYIP